MFLVCMPSSPFFICFLSLFLYCLNYPSLARMLRMHVRENPNVDANVKDIYYHLYQAGQNYRQAPGTMDLGSGSVLLTVLFIFPMSVY